MSKREYVYKWKVKLFTNEKCFFFTKWKVKKFTYMKSDFFYNWKVILNYMLYSPSLALLSDGGLRVQFSMEDEADRDHTDGPDDQQVHVLE